MVIVIDESNCKFGNIQYILKNNSYETFFVYKELITIEFKARSTMSCIVVVSHKS